MLFLKHLKYGVLEQDFAFLDLIQRPTEGCDPLRVISRGLRQFLPDLGGQNRGDDPLSGLNAEFHTLLDGQRLGQL